LQYSLGFEKSKNSIGNLRISVYILFNFFDILDFKNKKKQFYLEKNPNICLASVHIIIKKSRFNNYRQLIYDFVSLDFVSPENVEYPYDPNEPVDEPLHSCLTVLLSKSLIVVHFQLRFCISCLQLLHPMPIPRKIRISIGKIKN